MSAVTDHLAAARAVADAVLFEGYMLYPYRADDAKNRVRWQFGVLAPPARSAHEPTERDWLSVDCLVDGAAPVVTVRARFLQVQQRTVERAAGDGFVEVDRLELGAVRYLPWDEAVVVERELPAATAQFTVPGGREVQPLTDGQGAVVGRLVRQRAELRGELQAVTMPLPGPYRLRRLRLRLANRTEVGVDVAADRTAALRRALVAAHLLVSVEGGAFVSQLDPPEWAAPYLTGSEHVGVFPVLAGPPGRADLLLASPITLYDHPQLAPESGLSFCDATEIDEMLTLRTLTLTDEEKRAVRGSDPRAAQLLDEVEGLPPELLTRLHGAIRSLRPAGEPRVDPSFDPRADPPADPGGDVAMVGTVPVSRGHRVRLRPARRADAQDMFLDGLTATVQAVLFDVDGGTHLAVCPDDLATELAHPHGRFFFFAPDEVEPLGAPS